MKILLDEMYDGLDEQVKKRGHEVFYVKELKKADAKFSNDYNVLNHVKSTGMILITEDRQNGRACKDNAIPCISVDIDTVFERIILPELKRESL